MNVQNDQKISLLNSETLETNNIYFQNNYNNNLQKKNSFDFLFFIRLIKILKILYSSKGTIIITILLIICALIQLFVVSLTGDVIGGFYQVIIINK